MALPGMAFGKPLRHPSWRRLSVRQRLAFEALEFAAIDPKARKSLFVFWHNAHVPHLALIARADCAASLNICLNTADPGEFLPALTGLLWCTGLTVVRDTDDTFLRRSMCMVPIPPDFAGFDDDAEFHGKELPPVLAGSARFELTLGSMVKTASGPAAVAMGTVFIHERMFRWLDGDPVFQWLHGDADGIYKTGRVFLGTFLPPTHIEAGFLDRGLFFHRSTGLLPTFVGESPWVPHGPVTSHTIRIPYLRGCSVLDMATVADSRYAELDARARALRSLIDRAEKDHTMGAAGAQSRWEADRDAWEGAQVRLLEGVIEEISTLRSGAVPGNLLTGALTVHICSSTPRGGVWDQQNLALQQEIEMFADTPQGIELRQGPFTFATLAL